MFIIPCRWDFFCYFWTFHSIYKILTSNCSTASRVSIRRKWPMNNHFEMHNDYNKTAQKYTSTNLCHCSCNCSPLLLLIVQIKDNSPPEMVVETDGSCALDINSTVIHCRFMKLANGFKMCLFFVYKVRFYWISQKIKKNVVFHLTRKKAFRYSKERKDDELNQYRVTFIKSMHSLSLR